MPKPKKTLILPNKTLASVLISRVPYSKKYNSKEILEECQKVDLRGLICLSLPIHLENPMNSMKLINELADAGLHLVAIISWHRDRHIVASRSKRLTNAWEPIAIFSRSKEWFIDRDGPARPKRGAAGREEQFDEDEFLTCVGDHWPIRCDRRDRRLIPSQVVLNLIQLAGIGKGDSVLDPFGNPTIKEQCDSLGLKYIDSGLDNSLRDEWQKKKSKSKKIDQDDQDDN